MYIPVCLSSSSVAQLCLTLCDPWTVALQVPLSMKFSNQEYWSGLPFSPPGDLPNSEIEPTSLMSLALADGFFTNCTTWEDQEYWSGRPFPFPGNLPDPEIEPRSPALQADSLPSESPGEPIRQVYW